MEIAPLPNVRMAFTRQGRGKPLVLLHGFPMDHRLWDSPLSLLIDNFDVILPDFRGFGKSITTDISYSIDDMANDVIHLLDYLGINQAIVAGHSMGGYAALSFAKSFPDRLLGLGLIATQSLPDTPERKQARYETIKLLEVDGVESLAVTMAEKLSSQPRLREDVAKMIMRQSKLGIACALRALGERPDLTPVLGDLKVQVSIIHGDADILIPVERAMEMKEILPGSFMTILPGVGHLPMMEKPVETATALLRLG